MNKPFQVLWNVEKYILKYLTINMFMIKSKQYSEWLHISLNDSVIILCNQLNIKLTQFKYNYRMIAQLLREQKKKIDNQMRKFHKTIQTHAQKIQFDYLQREKQRQRLKLYLNIQSLQQLFSLTRQNRFQQFQVYHQIYKSLLQLKQYYLAYQHVEALPTFEDKQIYLNMLIVYHYDQIFNQEKYVKYLYWNTEQNYNKDKDEQINQHNKKNNQTKQSKYKYLPFNIIKNIKQSLGYTNTNDKLITITESTKSKTFKIQSISQFKQKYQNQKQIMKFIAKFNINKKLVYSNQINSQIQISNNIKNYDKSQTNEGKIKSKSSSEEEQINENDKQLMKQKYSILQKNSLNSSINNNIKQNTPKNNQTNKSNKIFINNINKIHIKNPQTVQLNDIIIYNNNLIQPTSDRRFNQNL